MTEYKMQITLTVPLEQLLDQLFGKEVIFTEGGYVLHVGTVSEIKRDYVTHGYLGAVVGFAGHDNQNFVIERIVDNEQ